MWLPLQSVTVSELYQGDLELDDALVASRNERHAQRSAHNTPSTPVSILVRYF